jgi:hypothetical protein
MDHKRLRPTPLVLIQGGRAGDCGDPGRTSNSHLTKNIRSVREATSPTVLTFIFASNGGVGFWVLKCPFCGYEHIHGPYRVYGFLERLANWNGHASHCHTRREWDGESIGHYFFAISGPAMLVPGQARGRVAHMLLDILEEQGCAVSRTTTLPSRESPYFWDKKTGAPIQRRARRH